MNYYPFHIGDYASATRHLSWDEDAAYRRLLDAYYVREGPLPTELRAVHRLVMATTPEQREATETVLHEFFELTPEGWRHKRCDAELERMREKSEKARESARLSVEARTRKANAQQPASERSANADTTSSERSENASEGSATNTNTNTKEGALRAPRATRKCPVGFGVTDEMRRWAAANASAVNVDRETVKFLNHTFKTSRSDWPATWRNWLLEAQDRMGARQGAPPESFRERDARVQSARVAEFTGGLVSARPKAEVIDVTARTVDRTDLLEDGSDLRRGLAAAVGRA